MAVTVSVIKTDIGGFVGHSDSHSEVIELACECTDKANRSGLIIDFYVTKCGESLRLVVTQKTFKENGEAVFRESLRRWLGFSAIRLLLLLVELIIIFGLYKLF